MVAILLGADNGFFYAGQIMHFSSPFTVFLIYHKQDTIEQDVGFSYFGTVHLLWLFVTLVALIVNHFIYRRMDDSGRNVWRKVFAWLLIADELFKMAILIYSGNYGVGYLPLHLCSINIILIAIHAYRPFPILGNFLYTVCIPGALAALLFPTWTSLPVTNGMHLHSFTVHLLLMVYPVVLTLNGDIRPDIKHLPRTLGLLVLMAVPIYIINLLLDTNFMFLMSADPGNPLYFFETLWGNHLFGFPVIIAGVLLVMYGPILLIQKLRKKVL